jgi:predicted acyl esterase
MHSDLSIKPVITLVPGQMVELAFDLQPTTTVFNAGHRIRVTITGADVDNTEPPPVRGRPNVRLYRGGEHASRIRSPIRGAPQPPAGQAGGSMV